MARSEAGGFVRAVMCSAWLVLGTVAQDAIAAQTLDIREGDTAVVRISVLDQTRLRADRGRLLDVIGDVYDAQRNPGGRIVVLKDEPEGEYYVKPVPAEAPGPVRPIKLDIKTDRGTVALLMQPADIVGETLTLRVAGGQRPAAQEVATRTRGPAHLRAIKALTLAMASPALSGEVPTRAMAGGGEVIALWQEARFVLLSRHEAPGLVGETYELTNVSRERMVIDERELYRPGVLAVAVMRLVLAPGETTRVWVVTQEAAGVQAAHGEGRAP